MEIKKFDLEKDLIKLEDYLRCQYLENKNMTSWLPERLHDLIFRMDTQHSNAGKPKSSNYIFLWEDNDEIVGCILPDGDAIYMSVKKGYEDLYKSIVSYAEENCKPLFEKEEDGTIKFVIIANDSLKYRREYLEQDGYEREKAEDYPGITSHSIGDKIDNCEFVDEDSMDKLIKEKGSVVMFMGCADNSHLIENYIDEIKK